MPKYPSESESSVAPSAKQTAVRQGATSPGTIGTNPNSTGGTAMQEIRDVRPERMSGATRFGDHPVKDMYLYSGGCEMCQNPSDSLLSATDGDRS